MSESEVRGPVHTAVPREQVMSATVFSMEATLSAVFSRDRMFVDVGPLTMQLRIEQARLLRDLLDAGLRDAAEGGHPEAIGYRVDLVKAVA